MIIPEIGGKNDFIGNSWRYISYADLYIFNCRTNVLHMVMGSPTEVFARPHWVDRHYCVFCCPVVDFGGRNICNLRCVGINDITGDKED